ncbi:snRNA-activating protein complex subunit 4 isoform X2 [Echinops telfairi]|uniref:snRNA-activating protein complex subunit 4 isoform X2 n=1 Tax=Echinops telfairi TaxID=9371 RepID=A0AC55D0E7_ECHTE|nr:snRNA-activating protein complex subunit 4 isoform X2 [Echinops telfairi]
MDSDSERAKITQEIRELERILEPGSSGVSLDLSESSLDSASDDDSLLVEDSDAPGPPIVEKDRWGEASNEEEEEEEEEPRDRNLPEDPETCLQLNMVYQEVVQEKMAEVNLLLAQNRAQQEEIMWDLAGAKGPKAKGRKSLPPHMYIGHFMKPYFKDKVTGVGPPANEDTREKAAQGVKSFEQLLVTKWKSWEKALLRQAVVSDRLQRLLQPKLLKLEYLQQKQSRAQSEPEKQLLEKQVQDAERDIADIHQLPEEALLGSRLDSHDWEKISNVNFEGGRSAEEIRKFWQNCEHPSINQQAWSSEEVERLQVLSAQHGHLQWQQIAEELGTRRSPFQCLQKYQQHNRALKRREWTEEEDCMLTQLVQEMRVGSHIPYRRIVYYMEGRDSMQLIYRWTKSLDPSLRKGCWTPEEDAKLLQAVAKHGEHDWFKIREEVPGRSDAQCRDRYLRRLRFNLRKGRWNPKEEEKLLELIEKHGVGHWAKIAAELPHRTGSQCLSKWKIMLGKKRRGQQGRRRPRRCVRWSSSSSDSTEGEDLGSSSSSSSEDTEAEPDHRPGPRGGGQADSYMVPSMDLWVPARQSGPAPRKGSSRDWPGLPLALTSNPQEAEAARQSNKKGPALGTHCGIPGSTDTCPARDKESGDETRSHLQEAPLETVQPTHDVKEQLPRPDLAGPPVRCLWPGSTLNGQQRRRQRHTLQRRLLTRRLLMAVGPWVDRVILPHTQIPQRPAVSTQADGVQKQLRSVQLTSTPVFTLLIQLLQIDTDGCLEVIGERRSPPPGPAAPGCLQARPCPGGLFPARPAQETTKQRAGHKDRGAQGSRQPQPTPQLAPLGPRPKPKTVSELLREKRLREARAKRATQHTQPPPVQMLLPVPRTPLPALQPTPRGLTAAGPAVCNQPLPGLGICAGPSQGSQTPASTGGTQQALAPTPTGARTSAHQASRHHVPVPSMTQKQGLPELPPLLPAVPSSARWPTLRLVTPPVAANTSLPVTWVLTTQGLLPVSMPAVVHLPGPTGASLTLLPSASAPGTSPAPHSPAVLAPRMAPASLSPAGASADPVSAPVTPPAPHSPAVLAPGTSPAPHSPAVLAPGTAPASLSPAGASADPVSAPVMPPAPHSSAGAPVVSAPRTTPASHSPARPPAVLAPGTSPASLSPAGASADPVSAPAMSSAPHSPAGASEDPALALRPPSPRNSAPPPETPSQAAFPSSPPEAELPSHSGAGLSSPEGSPGTPSETGRPLAPEQPPPPGPRKGALVTSLISLEDPGATQAWLRGQQGVCVLPLGSRLPYQPPTLCTLRTLASLLLHKDSLAREAATLVPGCQELPPAGALEAAREMVHVQLRDSPAYLLLKARFLATFSLSALLATLPPRGIPTTLSVTPRLGSDSECEDLEGPTLPDGTGLPEGTQPQVAASCCSDIPDDLWSLRTRHSRKRRRLS